MRVWPFCFALVACSSSTPHSAPVDGGAHDSGSPAHDAGESDAGHDAGSPEPDAGGAIVDCGIAKDGIAVGTLEDKDLAEASGVAASRQNPGVLWLHNDSGDSARLFATESDGDAIATLAVDGADFVDWEDIAVGPGPDAAHSYVYIGDIGDNNEERTGVQIYRVEEPVRSDDGTFPSARVTAHRIDVTYEDDPHDAETLLVDPVSGDLYIVTKGALLLFDAPVPVYRVAASDLLGARATATRVGTVPMGPATGGDVRPDGSGIALRNYTDIRYFARREGEALHEAFERVPCALPLTEAFGEQGEALGFAADGSGYYTTAEAKNAPLRFYAFK